MRDNNLKIGDKVECICQGSFCDNNSVVLKHYITEAVEVDRSNIHYLSNTKYFKLIETLSKGDKVRCIAIEADYVSLHGFKIGNIYEVKDSGCGMVEFVSDDKIKVRVEVNPTFWKMFEKIYSGPIFKDLASELANMFMDDQYWGKVYGEIPKIKTPIFDQEQEQRIKELIRLVNNEQNKQKKAS